MTDKKLNIYCVTNKIIPYLESLELKLAGVGESNFNKKYLLSNTKDNIFYKEKVYSELTFHYWYWKNILDLNDKSWNGFSQRRRHWIKTSSEDKYINYHNLSDHILIHPEEDWEKYESIICKPIKVNNVKKIKILKRGLKSFIKNPSIIYNINKQNLLLHFDMHHGYGNLEKAISVLSEEDRDDFSNYVNSKTQFNPHIMYISKNFTLNRWFNSLFPWLQRCEKIFGHNLRGYDTGRLYAYLAERYSSFWFKKYTKYKEHSWIFLDK